MDPGLWVHTQCTTNAQLHSHAHKMAGFTAHKDVCEETVSPLSIQWSDFLKIVWEF